MYGSKTLGASLFDGLVFSPVLLLTLEPLLANFGVLRATGTGSKRGSNLGHKKEPILKSHCKRVERLLLRSPSFHNCFYTHWTLDSAILESIQLLEQGQNRGQIGDRKKTPFAKCLAQKNKGRPCLMAWFFYQCFYSHRTLCSPILESLEPPEQG